MSNRALCYTLQVMKRAFNQFQRFFSGVSGDLGIDLGTANTVVYLKGFGIVMREPSVVAIDANTQAVMAIGNEAYHMVGRTPGNIVAVRPMKDGVVADYNITEKMIAFFIKHSIPQFRLNKPRVVVGVPYGITAVERRAVLDAAHAAGSSAVSLVEEPLAAALGAGMKLEEPIGRMIVDIGGGTTEVAVLSLGGLVNCRSIRVAGDEFDEAIINHCRKHYNLLIGERMAEKVKIDIGSASAFPEEREMVVKGRDLLTGLPKTFTLSSYEIRDALYEPLQTIVDAVKLTLEQTAPELVADVMRDGVALAGGGSLIYGLADLLASQLGVRFYVANDPLSCVAIGTGLVLNTAFDNQKKLNVVVDTKGLRF